MQPHFSETAVIITFLHLKESVDLRPSTLVRVHGPDVHGQESTLWEVPWAGQAEFHLPPVDLDVLGYYSEVLFTATYSGESMHLASVLIRE